MKPYSLRTAAALALAAGAAPGVLADQAKVEAIAVTVCGACHGADGNSATPAFPKLAGLDSAYLHKQLEDFQAKRRQSEIMQPMVDALSEQELAGLAAYFAGKKSVRGAATEPALVETGRKLYGDGNPVSGVPACSGCHGADGEGNGRFPRLAGQHAEYMTNQLKLFAASARKNDKRLMQAVAYRLTEKEMHAVAQFLASQP